jgi:hypothetical protein
MLRWFFMSGGGRLQWAALLQHLVGGCGGGGGGGGVGVGGGVDNDVGCTHPHAALQVTDDDLPPSPISPTDISSSSNGSSSKQSRHERHHIRCSPVAAAGAFHILPFITTPRILNHQPSSQPLPPSTALCLLRLRITSGSSSTDVPVVALPLLQPGKQFTDDRDTDVCFGDVYRCGTHRHATVETGI